MTLRERHPSLIDSLKMFPDLRSLTCDTVTEISTWKWEESIARSVIQEFYHINVKPRVVLWSEGKKRHQRNSLIGDANNGRKTNIVQQR